MEDTLQFRACQANICARSCFESACIKAFVCMTDMACSVEQELGSGACTPLGLSGTGGAGFW